MENRIKFLSRQNKSKVEVENFKVFEDKFS